MSASEQASEPSSSLPPLPPPLPPPPRPPVAAEGRGAQAAPADAVWARIREAPRSNSPAATGLLICVRLACAPPPARLICMHIPRRHIPELNPAAAGAAAAGRGAEPARGRGAGRPGGRREGEGMHSSLPPLQPEVSPLGQTLWGFRGFGDGKKKKKKPKKKVCNLPNLFPSSRETTRLSRGKGGECCPGKKSQQTVRAQNAPTPTLHAAPRALAVPGGGEVCKSVGSVSGACPGPRRPGAFCLESGPR